MTSCEGLSVRPLRPEQIPAAAELHEAVLGMEFISRCGQGFLRRYYRGWIGSPGAIGLAAQASDGGLAGVLLGATEPRLHARAMLRSHGAALALRLAIASLRRPSLARELLRTRLLRYARGTWRLLSQRDLPQPPGDAGLPPSRVAEVTHLLVAPPFQGKGVGRALLQSAAEAARRAGRQEVVLVTLPHLEARRFYERLGWTEGGEVTSRSGERFVRFKLTL